MKVDLFGKCYAAAMSIYFMLSGFNALVDIDAKLARIGLTAADLDGKVAFILIYCSLMIGIGFAIGIIYYLSKTWVYSAALAVSIVSSFIIFRFAGAIMLGEMTSVQMSFVAVEFIEAAIGIGLIIKSQKSKGKLKF